MSQFMQVLSGASPAGAPLSLKPLADIANAWRQFMIQQRHPYKPEKHYMRGPGPKWREKHARQSAASHQ